ncbi:MAG: Gfo/Idh/MocA family protein, partial [Planctomycetota bacterium]
RQLIYEIRIWSNNFPHGCDMAAEFYGTQGTIMVSLRGKIQILDAKNQPLNVEPKNPRQIITNHRADFVDAVRTGRRPNADIEDGFLSGTLCHLGNICMRVGRTLRFDPQNEQIVGDKEANNLLRREYRKNHWAIPQGV